MGAWVDASGKLAVAPHTAPCFGRSKANRKSEEGRVALRRGELHSGDSKCPSECCIYITVDGVGRCPTTL